MTIKDIARESGYAVGTVSRVLNHHPGVSEEARARVLEVVEKYHFQLNSNAKHLKQQAGNGIAIIIKGRQNMLFTSIVEQMQGLIKQKGFACLIYYIDEDENELDQALLVCRERRPLGILFLGSNQEYFVKRFSEIAIPCIFVTNSAASLGYPNLSSVGTDDTEAAKTAVTYLFSLGHKYIGILGGNTEISHAASARFKGCLQAFEEKGVSFQKEHQYVTARFSMSDGYHAMEQLLDQMPELTAVFAMSDVMAVGAIRAIRERGLRVPEDISVMGFDGIELGRYMTPQLTTIRQHKELIAARSVEILLDCIMEEKNAVYEITPFHLIPGESVAKA